MDHQHKIALEEIILAVQKGYGIELENLEFLLRGWGGDCYAAETREGKRYFLKLHDEANYMGIAVTSRPFYLPLMDQLHAKGILPHIPHPVATKTGALSLGIDAHELVVTNYIDADLVGFGELSEPILAQLAELVGILHRSCSQLEFEHPLIEQFEFAFKAELIDSFERVAAITSKDRIGKQLLRQTFLPYTKEVQNALQYFQALQEQVRTTQKPKVICHTDLHGGNLMTDQQGNLYILDWENAMIAPPEHDLFFFAGAKNFWDVFWPRYSSRYEAASIDCDILTFYFYRRVLEDIAGFVLRILQGEGSEERDRADIDWLKGNFEELGQIDDTVAKIRERI